MPITLGARADEMKGDAMMELGNYNGAAYAYEDAANALIPEAYEKALEECEETIVSSPKINVTQIEEGKSFIFTAEVH